MENETTGLAVESGFNPANYDILVTEINARKTKIQNIFSSIIETMPAKIEEAYSGEAATKYKERLLKTMESLDLVFDDLIKNLMLQAKEWQTAYQSQDKANADSLAEVSTTNVD